VSKIDHAKRNEVAVLQRELRQVNTYSGSDSSHPGTGADSIQLGVDGEASEYKAAAFGRNAKALAMGATAIGSSSYAAAEDSIAAGHLAVVNVGDDRSSAFGWGAETSAADQVVVGHPTASVEVPGDLTVAGTFSNPSARHLKQNIVAAPAMVSVFPVLAEYEYIAREGERRIGYIADELVGTDAERFLKFDGDGRPVAIDYLGLLVAQVSALSARVIELERG